MIVTTFKDRYIVHVGTALVNHLQSVAIVEEGEILLHYNDEKMVYLSRSLLHQIAMPLGEGVGIHNDEAHLTSRYLLTLSGEVVLVTVEFGERVLHKEGVRRLGNQLVTQRSENVKILWLGIHLGGEIAVLHGHTHQMRHQHVEKPLFAHLLPDGDTFYNIMIEATRGEQFVLLQPKNAKILFHSVQPQPVFGKECFHH